MNLKSLKGKVLSPREGETKMVGAVLLEGSKWGFRTRTRKLSLDLGDVCVVNWLAK